MEVWLEEYESDKSIGRRLKGVEKKKAGRKDKITSCYCKYGLKNMNLTVHWISKTQETKILLNICEKKYMQRIEKEHEKPSD